MKDIRNLFSRLNMIIPDVYANAVNHGWHEEDKPDAHWFCLVISELCEAVQADRLGKRAEYDKMMDMYNNIRGIPSKVKETVTNDAITFSMESYYADLPMLFEKYIKDSVEDELADAVIRILDYSGMYNLELKYFEVFEDIRDIRQDSLFSEDIYFITNTCTLEYLTQRYKCSLLVYIIFKLADKLNINLLTFIKLKMEYNKTREYKHGKKY